MHSRSVINVGCAGNAAYALPMSVLLTSVVCNSRTNRALHFYVMESGMTDALKQKVENSVLRNKRSDQEVRFHWARLDARDVERLPRAGSIAYMSPDTYSRLLIPGLLPAEADQLIYLDSDMVVLKDLAGLSDCVDENSTISAVANVLFPYVSSVCDGTRTIVFDYAQLGIPPKSRYFNAGVLVINLKRWRDDFVAERVIDYLQRNRDGVILHDQGGLNAVLHDQWSRLDQRWNQTNVVLIPEWWKRPAFTREEWLMTRNDPFIVHYSGGDKPWHPGFKRPRLSFFTHYLEKTLFKDDLSLTSAETIIGYRNYFRLWRTKKMVHSLVSK